MLVWCDLETTGTNPAKDVLLEVACVVTDDALNEVARYERTINGDIVRKIALQFYHYRATDSDRQLRRLISELGDQVDPVVLEMHLKNGLWERCEADGVPLEVVEAELEAFLWKHAIEQIKYIDPETNKTLRKLDKPQLAGSTISFDRGFIARYMPRVEELLHHRNVDVSTFNETSRRFWPEVYTARPRAKDKAHRGMSDIAESITVFKHYLARLAPVPQEVS